MGSGFWTWVTLEVWKFHLRCQSWRVSVSPWSRGISHQVVFLKPQEQSRVPQPFTTHENPIPSCYFLPKNWYYPVFITYQDCTEFSQELVDQVLSLTTHQPINVSWVPKSWPSRGGTINTAKDWNHEISTAMTPEFLGKKELDWNLGGPEVSCVLID